MYLYAVDFLAQHGYEQYEISNFCRSGRESCHNSRYWALSEYLGFGPGAHSDFGGERFSLARDLDAYLADTPSIPSAPRPRRVSGRPSASCSRSARPAASPRIRCRKPRGAFSGIVKPTASPSFRRLLCPHAPRLSGLQRHPCRSFGNNGALTELFSVFLRLYF